VTHAHEAIGKDVKQEAADEFLGIEGVSFEPIFVFSVPVGEGDLTVLGREDTVIGEGYSVGVAAQVIKDLLWGGEGLFGIDHPLFFLAELRRWTGQFALVDGFAQQVEELTPKDNT